MTTHTQLKPCPFCGCTDISLDNDGDYEWLKCDWCHATGGVDPAPEFEGQPVGWHWDRRATADVTEATAALVWAMDEIDALSNKLSGFAYPQGMAYARRPEHQEAYVRAVNARKALASLNPPMGR